MRWAKRSRSFVTLLLGYGRAYGEESECEVQVKREVYDGRMDGWVDRWMDDESIGWGWRHGEGGKGR